MTSTDAISRAAAQVPPSCSLDAEGRAAQRARHRQLAPSVVGMTREGDLLLVNFAEGFDRQALDELIATERECCPFFAFSFDEQGRRLEVGVHHTQAAGALEAIAAAFSS